MRLRDEPSFLPLSNENNSLIHLMESFREVHKKRRKALGTHKNSVNCSYLFLIGLKPNLYFSRGIFSSKAKPCPTAELRSAGRLPICTAKLPRTRTPRLRSARDCKRRRRQEAAQNLVRGPQPPPLLPRKRAGSPPSPKWFGATGTRSLLRGGGRGFGLLKPGGGRRRGAEGRRLRRERENSRFPPPLPKLETADSGGTKPPDPR